MNPTKKEKLYWDRLAELGCAACLSYSKVTNNYISIHHISGRSKKGCHMNVLALCPKHHMTGKGETIPIHPFKKRFEAKYGTQKQLKMMCDKLLEDD
jgi:hypothetical protein|tara:strand:+ start:3572 stop:3862 length:291 start_codon:yes stop_codon:yes gene_type:complete